MYRSILAIVVAAAAIQIARADIYRWDNGQLIPGTEGIALGPGVDLSNRGLDFADLGQANLQGATFESSNVSFGSFAYTDVSNAVFRNADLSDATFDYAEIAGADFTDATIARVNLSGYYQDFKAAQLYSTASYKLKNLQGIQLATPQDFRTVAGVVCYAAWAGAWSASNWVGDW